MGAGFEMRGGWRGIVSTAFALGRVRREIPLLEALVQMSLGKYKGPLLTR